MNFATQVDDRFGAAKEAASVAQDEADLERVQEAIEYVIFATDEDLFRVVDMHNLTCTGTPPGGFGDEAWAWNEEDDQALYLEEDCVPEDTVQLHSYAYVEQ